MGIKGPYYCGPQWWPEFLRRFLSQRFNPCCLQHDTHYEKGPRSYADREFRRCLKCYANDLLRWQVVGAIFYVFVYLLGWMFKKSRRWSNH